MQDLLLVLQIVFLFAASIVLLLQSIFMAMLIAITWSAARYARKMPYRIKQEIARCKEELYRKMPLIEIMARILRKNKKVS